MSKSPSERVILFLVAAVQFVNILDFVMVMPLGPDFAKALGIPASSLGLIGGSYTAAAAVSGLVCATFLDKFDRRPALGLAMLGLVLGTALGGLAHDLPTLLAARVLAGMFGGPATSLSFSIIADVIPPARRGKAMGAVMGAFSVASVVGVPAGLKAAEVFGWRAPFFGVAGMGLIVATTAVFLLPSLRGHLERGAEGVATRFADLASRPLVLLSWTMTAVVMMAGFVVIPTISPYVQENLHYPRTGLGQLYMLGGVVSLAATQAGGRLVDRFGSFAMGVAGTLINIVVVEVGFGLRPGLLPVPLLFVGFMLGMGLRNVAYTTLTSRVPSMGERARFMSIQSSVQHAASALGAFLSARLLTELPDHQLAGMDQVAHVSIACSVFVMVFLRIVQAHVLRRDQAAFVPPAASLQAAAAEGP